MTLSLARRPATVSVRHNGLPIFVYIDKSIVQLARNRQSRTKFHSSSIWYEEVIRSLNFVNALLTLLFEFGQNNRQLFYFLPLLNPCNNLKTNIYKPSWSMHGESVVMFNEV